jgi:hypothetical protein
MGKAIEDDFFNIIDENDGNIRVGTAGSVFVRTNNKDTAEKCAKLANDLIHDSVFIQRAKELDNRKSEIEVKLKAFDDALVYIDKDLEQSSKSLEGKCWLCKRIKSVL